MSRKYVLDVSYCFMHWFLKISILFDQRYFLKCLEINEGIFSSMEKGLEVSTSSVHVLPFPEAVDIMITEF